ncbi:MAG: para-aminobenzoate synthetase component [Acidimicrobiaceae bacterium]|nr:para-aminobenzoate synthetase component [Acidimicrobiaceae bacterium]
MPASLAVVGGRLATDLLDVTSDVAALDSEGFWVVVSTFEGSVTCARFGSVRPFAPRGAEGWAPVSGWRSSMSRSAWDAGVHYIREAIAAGDVYQVNLTRRLSAVCGASSLFPLFLRVRAGAPHAAYISLPDVGLEIASASPERFLRRDGPVVESQPIKGTAATRGRFLAKDRAENVMIVDLVRNDLGRVCEYGSVEVPALCAVEAHPGLFHLVSTVRGTLRPDVGWGELLQAAFPAGSVTGAPKLAALDVIAKLEPLPRGPYCGAIGWVDGAAGRGDLNVGIRTFWLDGGSLHFGTGGGITWDSTPHGEWEETELKARRLVAAAS